MLAEFKRYVTAARKWGWLAVFSMILAAGATVGVAQLTPPSYQASAGIKLSTQNPSSADYINLLGGERLIQTFLPVVTSTSVLQPVTQQYPQISESALASSIKMSYQTDGLGTTISPILVIIVTNGDPKLAADLANAVANALITLEINDNSLYSAQRTQAVNAEIAQLQDQISGLKAALKSASQQGAGPAPVAALEAALNSVQAEESTMQGVLLDIQARGDRVQKDFLLVTPAPPPAAPVPQQLTSHVLASLLVGLIAALGLGVLLEALSDKARTVSSVERWAQPVLGVIPPSADLALIAMDASSPLASAYRALRARLGIATARYPLHSLLIASPPPHGATAARVASNLAIAFASSGRQVLLVDAAMERPTLHTLFQVTNDQGLSVSLTELRRSSQAEHTSLHSTAVAPGVALVTAGPKPLSPTDLLDSPALQRFMTEVQMRQVDLLIMVSAPILATIDATIIGSRVDGVLITVNAEKTTTTEIERAVALLHRGSAAIVGGVLCNSDEPLPDAPPPSADETPAGAPARAATPANDVTDLQTSYQPVAATPRSQPKRSR